MPKSDDSFNSAEYTPVARRIELFYGAYPSGRIITNLVSCEKGRAIVGASVFRDAVA